MRLFFAVLLSDAARDAIARAQQELRSAAHGQGIRWTPVEQLHCTLEFLGETPDERLAGLLGRARRAAAAVSPFSLDVAGVGSFPDARGRAKAPRVLWVGFSEGLPHLARLAELLHKEIAIEASIDSERPVPDARQKSEEFHPHVTLARVKTPEGAREAAAVLNRISSRHNNVDISGITIVDGFVLMHSELRPAGAVYTVVERFALSGPSPPSELREGGG